jgi:ABC-type antimicrobial peptide transport system permease subunit
MFKNYITIALRNIRRYKGFSFINIIGLAIGMACCILIFLWLQDEMSYDRFHENSGELYRVITETYSENQTFQQSRAPSPLGPALKQEYPEIVNFTRYRGGITNWRVKYGEKAFMNDRLALADPSFFEMFTFPFIAGDPKTALKERFSLVITEDMAKKYFGNEAPLGKVIDLDGTDMTITGVIKSIPRNSHMQFDCMFPIINMADWWEENFEDWERYRFHTYIQLEKGTNYKEVNGKISGIIKKYLPKSENKVYLQPLTDIHLYSSDFRWDDDNIGKGNITYVYILSLTALCILLMACINFINLSTARSSNRAKEVGMRKVTGAHRSHIITQFFGESVVLSILALIFAIAMVLLFIPVFNDLSGKQLSMDFSGSIILGLICVTIFAGLVAGSYPAFLFSSFQPVTVLKIAGGGESRGGYLRKSLVVVQFTLAIILIIATTVIYNQLNFISSKDLGYDKDHVVYFYKYGEFGRNIEAVRNELFQNPNILSVSMSGPPLVTFRGRTDVNWEGKNPDQEIMMHPYFADYEYLRTFNMKMVQGRYFSKEFATDNSNYIINETALKLMGFKSPVGKRLLFRGREGTIIGVIKDFHSGSLHNKIAPLIIMCRGAGPNMSIKINSKNVPQTIKFLEEKWEKFVPDFPFSYTFLDETIDNYYNTEKRIGTISQYFTFLAIFIACLGLLGLVSYMAEQKTKEIGIRKVLGSSVANIVLLLSKDFVKWIITAFIIALPVAWYLMDNWLRNFAYRVGIGWWVFLFAGGGALLIALLIVSYRIIKAAQSNPVDSLRYE